MAADAPMGPTDAARATEDENCGASSEMRPAEPIRLSIQCSNTEYRVRAVVRANANSPGRRPGSSRPAGAFGHEWGEGRRRCELAGSFGNQVGRTVLTEFRAHGLRQ